MYECSLGGDARNSPSAASFTVPFPFPPYATQRRLIALARTACEAGGVWVLESPTGTGKTLSLLTGTLSWLQERCADDNDGVDTVGHPVVGCSQKGEQGRSHSSTSSSDDEHYRSGAPRNEGEAVAGVPTPRRARHRLIYASRTHSQLAQVVDEMRRTTFAAASPSPLPPTAISTSSCASGWGDAGAGGREANAATVHGGLRFLHLASRAQLCINDRIREASRGSSERLNDMCRKAVVAAANRKGGRRVDVAARSPSTGKAVALADVEDLIGESSGASATGGCLTCRFADPEGTQRVADHLRLRPRSIGELTAIGQRVGGCPFLASRIAVEWSDVLLLPYPYLLDLRTLEAILGAEGAEGNESRKKRRRRAVTRHMTTSRSLVVLRRERDGGSAAVEDRHDHGDEDSDDVPADLAEGVSSIVDEVLHSSVVVIDEAHNIADAAANATHVHVSAASMDLAEEAIRSYLELYGSRLLIATKQRYRTAALALKNMASLVDRVVCDEAPAKAAEGPLGGPHLRSDDDGRGNRGGKRFASINEFLFDAKIDHVNFFDVCDLLDERHGFARTLAGVHVASQQRAREQRLVTHHSGADRTTLVTAAATTTADFITVMSALHSAHRLFRLLAEGEAGNVLVVAAPASLAAESTSFVGGDGGAAGVVTPEIRAAPAMPPGRGSLSVSYLSPHGVTEGIALRARSLILAGGTMQPFDILVRDLFPHYQLAAQPPTVKVEQRPGMMVYTASLPHVVPADNIAVLSLGCGASGGAMPLRFAFDERRRWPQMLKEAAGVIINLARLTPGGVVVFFPSYAMLGRFVAEAKTADGGAGSSTPWSLMNGVKTVFVEEQGKDVDALLKAYIARIDWARLNSGKAANNSSNGNGAVNVTGALLLSVMGGRLSEGINFADDYGRCVVVVGMPYPNPFDPRLAAKMDFLDETFLDTHIGSSTATSDTVAKVDDVRSTAVTVSTPSRGGYAKRPGARYYDALCMRSVNQSIGRCIRHAKDYAAIVLLDVRFHSPATVAGLPTWIQQRHVRCNSLGEAVRAIVTFFRSKVDAAA